MAQTYTRDFWIVPGDVDKDGQPREYAEAPKRLPLVDPRSAPVAIHEEMGQDGEYVQYRHDPASGQWVEFKRDVDKNRLDLYKTRRADEPKAQTADEARHEKASADLAEAQARAATGPKEPTPQTPEETAHTQAQTALVQAQTAAVKPQSITRPNARTGEPEMVSTSQADYDRQAGQDQRQAAIDLQARVQAAESTARDAARLRIEQEKWTAEQAATEYNKTLDAIRLEAQKEALALTRRSQDITLRGQDVSAGVTQRGQDLDFQGGLVRSATGLAEALIPGYAQPEQWSAIRQGINQTRAIGGQAPLPDFRGGPPPYDPMAFTNQAAAAALQQTPPRYQLPGAPGQVPPGNYVLPG